MKLLKILSHILFSTILAIILVSLLVEDATWLKLRVEHAVIMHIEKSYNCKITTHVERLRLIGGEVTFHEMQAFSRSEKAEEQWSWSAKRTVVGVSWIRLLMSRVIDLDIALDSVMVKTQSDGIKFAITSHIFALMARVDSVLPVVIRSFEIRNGLAHALAPALESDLAVKFMVDSYTQRGKMRFVIGLDAGVLQIKKRNFLQKIAGITTIHFDEKGYLQDAQMDVVWDDLQLPAGKQHCVLAGKINNKKSIFEVHNEDHSLQGNLILQDVFTASVHVPFAYLVNTFNGQLVNASGNCIFDLSGNISDLEQTFKGSLKLVAARYEKTILPDVQITTVGIAHFSKGIINLEFLNKIMGEGTWHWNAYTEEYVIDLKNTSKIGLPAAWEIAPKNISLQARIDKDYRCKATYSSVFTHKKRQERKQVDGKVIADKKYIEVTGDSGADLSYAFDVALTTPWHIRTATVHVSDKELMNLTGSAEGVFSGTLAYPALRGIMQMLTPALEQEFSGEGVFALDGVITADAVRANIKLHNGTIRLPYTYNLLQAFTAALQFDLATRKFTVTDMYFGLYKGAIKVSRVTMFLDDSYALSFLQAPVLLHDCFLSWKKDIYALLSGSLMVRYDAVAGAAITGQCIFDRSHMRGNVLSPGVKDDIFGMTVKPLMWSQNNSAVTLDVVIKTRAPLQVKTSFLEATVRSNLVLRGTLAQPELFGELELLNGQLLFPYQPLYIVRGKVFFLAHQLDDPGIELVARGVIKKYSLELFVSGTLRNPIIRFESSPSLQEEQIIGLLLGGTEEGSLHLGLPAMVKNNIEHLLFGPAEESSAMQQSLKKLFKPLRNIKIIPSFSDQSGRGGLRGTLAIEVNDRLRGSIQQNFSLSEDTLLEVEYALSDDTWIRAMQDERGDLGAEIETRWKF